MINLLPPNVRSEIGYARRNTKLLRWTIALIICAFGAFAIIGFGYLYLSQSTRTYARQLEEGQERLKAQKLDETQARVSEISANLKLVIQVLSREILFSKVLRQVGAVLPAGSVLTNLAITDVEGGIGLSFEATDYQTGTQILLNLQDPQNKLFDKADIENITCTAELQEGQTYPCRVTIRALFGDKSPYLFINEGGRR